MATRIIPREGATEEELPAEASAEVTIPMEITVRIDYEALRDIQEEEPAAVEISVEEVSELLEELTDPQVEPEV